MDVIYLGMSKEEKQQRDEYEEERETDDELLENETRRASQNHPDDIYSWKKLQLIPEAQTEFEGLIDKDVVNANLKEPDREQLEFQAGTIIWTQELFVCKQNKTVVNPQTGEKHTFYDVMAFDEEFRPILKVLLGRFKYRHVSSQATGDLRTRILDVLSLNKIQKEYSKKNDKSKFGVT